MYYTVFQRLSAFGLYFFLLKLYYEGEIKQSDFSHLFSFLLAEESFENRHKISNSFSA